LRDRASLCLSVSLSPSLARSLSVSLSFYVCRSASRPLCLSMSLYVCVSLSSMFPSLARCVSLSSMFLSRARALSLAGGGREAHTLSCSTFRFHAFLRTGSHVRHAGTRLPPSVHTSLSPTHAGTRPSLSPPYLSLLHPPHTRTPSSLKTTMPVRRCVDTLVDQASRVRMYVIVANSIKARSTVSSQTQSKNATRPRRRVRPWQPMQKLPTRMKIFWFLKFDFVYNLKSLGWSLFAGCRGLSIEPF
jgi:hypothetical protein